MADENNIGYIRFFLFGLVENLHPFCFEQSSLTGFSDVFFSLLRFGG
jgi:hypothetical protein